MLKFWYSLYEFMKKNPKWSDTPYMGISFFLSFIGMMFFGGLVGIWQCLHLAYGIPPMPKIDISSGEVLLFTICVMVLPGLLFRWLGPRWVAKFKDETEKQKKRRRTESNIVLGLLASPMWYSLVWIFFLQ